MKQIKFKFLHLNIRVDFHVRKRRGKVLIVPVLTNFLFALKMCKKTRTGSKASRFFRHIFERVNVKAFLGGNLALFIALSATVSPISAVRTESELSSLKTSNQPILTDVAIQYPVTKVAITQGFYFLHPGIDLRGLKGEPVKPIMDGVVIRVEKSRFGYGNSVVLDHKNGYQSRYAHFSKILVEEGQEVDTRTMIGEIGATGHATGNHLHLEIYKNGIPINPLSLLGKVD